MSQEWAMVRKGEEISAILEDPQHVAWEYSLEMW